MNNNNPKILFFINAASFTTIPKGGGNAVAYMYYQEKNKRKDDNTEFLNLEISDNNGVGRRILKKFPKWIQESIHWFRNRKALISYLKEPPKTKPLVDFSNYDILFFHNTRSLYNEYNNLKDYKGIVVLQSHSPEPLSWELYEELSPSLRDSIKDLRAKYEIIDKIAFERADYIIFPCKEALEPYFKWDYFNDLYKRRQNVFRYVLTGIPAVSPRRSRDEVAKELNIPSSSFIVSYVGRHNEVKGFDILKNIASEFLKSNDNAYFISAGKESPLHRLDHPHWKEIGWTDDAYSYISSSDVFVLPNRETYFDLVLLEVLSLGKVVLASNTGGNKYFASRHLKGVFVYNTPDEAIRILKELSELTPQQLTELGSSNRSFFEENCQVSSMYDNYKIVMNSIFNG